MDVLECIKTRRSIRKFKKEPVEWIKIAKVLESGLAAPSAGNLQDFRLMAVTDEGKRRKIAHFCMEQLWMVNAPVFIVVSSTFEKTKRYYGVRGERLYSIQSAAAAAQNILLAAYEQGLGACWVGAFDENPVAELLNIPDYCRVQAIIPIGYPDEKVPCPPKYGVEQMCHINMFGDNAGKVWDIRKDILKEWSPYVEETVDSVKKVFDNDSKLGEKISSSMKKIRDKFVNK